MKISKKEDFSLIFMGILAENYPGKYVPLSLVASKTNISVLFLKHIASDLLRKKLIVSKEGIGGGYRLVKNPQKIKIAEILGTISSAGVFLPCYKSSCRIRKDDCVCNDFWNKVNEKLTSYLQNISLSEFISQ